MGQLVATKFPTNFLPVPYIECFHTRADSKLQWRIVIAIFELLSVHTREKTSLSVQFSIPERGEEA